MATDAKWSELLKDLEAKKAAYESDQKEDNRLAWHASLVSALSYHKSPNNKKGGSLRSKDIQPHILFYSKVDKTFQPPTTKISSSPSASTTPESEPSSSLNWCSLFGCGNAKPYVDEEHKPLRKPKDSSSKPPSPKLNLREDDF